jgi:branched-chain amino acid transport system permease protein
MTSESIDIINAFALLTNFVILPALSYGSQLALGALAVTLVYSILRFSNFAQGDSMAFGTMLVILISSYMISRGWTITGIPTALLAIPLALIGMSIYLLTMDRLVYRHYRRIKAKSIVGISASTLSVPISNSISSVAMVSPTPFRHSKIVPSVIDSPILGITTSVILTSCSFEI